MRRCGGVFVSCGYDLVSSVLYYNAASTLYGFTLVSYILRQFNTFSSAVLQFSQLIHVTTMFQYVLCKLYLWPIGKVYPIRQKVKNKPLVRFRF